MCHEPLKLWIDGRGIYRVHTLRHASAAYGQLRDDSGEGASTFPEGRVFRGREEVAKISYNGRVWLPGPWSPGISPICEAAPLEPAMEFSTT